MKVLLNMEDPWDAKRLRAESRVFENRHLSRSRITLEGGGVVVVPKTSAMLSTGVSELESTIRA